MKNNITIFTLAVFFLAQFGKVINFCYCKAVVYQQTNTFICDCEKILYSMPPADNPSKEKPPQSISSHQQSEEFFHLSAIPVFNSGHYICIRKWPNPGIDPLYDAFVKSLLRPPLQAA